MSKIRALGRTYVNVKIERNKECLFGGIRMKERKSACDGDEYVEMDMWSVERRE